MIPFILTLSFIGILNTSYLAYHSVTGKAVTCLFFPDEWCRKVQFSKYSKTFGIPNSFAGLSMYVALIVLTLAYSNGTIPFWPIMAIITIGFLFSLYFTYIQGFVLKAFCTYCVISALDFILLFVVTPYLI